MLLMLQLQHVHGQLRVGASVQFLVSQGEECWGPVCSVWGGREPLPNHFKDPPLLQGPSPGGPQSPSSVPLPLVLEGPGQSRAPGETLKRGRDLVPHLNPNPNPSSNTHLLTALSPQQNKVKTYWNEFS